MNDFQAHGSAQLTPAAIRAARFRVVEQGFAAGEVIEFLEQVASAMEVLGSSDAAEAMRRELQRNVEISSRMIAAGQATSEQLRDQAAADARAIIEDTKQLAEQLRDSARDEVRRTQVHIDELRATFIDELREMYDRLGASLYRFETVSRTQQLRDAGPEGASSPTEGATAQPQAAPAPGWTATAEPGSASLAAPGDQLPPVTTTDGPGGTTPAHEAAGSEPDADDAGGVQPAWAQLDGAVAEAPPLTWQHADVGWSDEVAEHDEGLGPDIVLAEGEPLVDLRGLGDVPPAEVAVEVLGQLDPGAAEPVAIDAAMLVETALEADMPGAPQQGTDPAVEALVAEASPDSTVDATDVGHPTDAGQPLDAAALPGPSAEALAAEVPADVAPPPIADAAGSWLTAPLGADVHAPDPAAQPAPTALGAADAATLPPTTALVEEVPAAVAPAPPAAATGEEAAAADAFGSAWLHPPIGEQQPAAAGAAPMPPDPAAQAALAVEPESADPIADDARAEALIAGVGEVLDTVGVAAGETAAPPAPEAAAPAPPEVAPIEPVPLPEPPQLSSGGNGGHAAESGGGDAVRAFVLQAMFEGSPRDQIEVHLRETLGIADPTAVIDGILAEQQG